jgi:formamidopyrimidine-DNA glycosylase
MRFHDPRRFGSILWQKYDKQLSLLKKLGPEPLSYEFDENSLFNSSIGKTKNIKTFIMDSSIVVGVGNIYASESLFLAGISPKRQAGKTSKKRYKILVNCIKEVLAKSINNGGTTLNDFSNVDGEPGYFSQILSVYDRNNMPCKRCEGTITKIVQNQRATYYCPKCQN